MDKPFVRLLDAHLRRHGFETWLDEKDVLVGDALPYKVSQAVGSARAVIVVISQSSVQSSWVRHEISQAAHRMISGTCRLLPVLIEDVALPDELTGLVYADCRSGRRGGTKRIIDALDEEAKRTQAKVATIESPDTLTRSRGINRLVRETFQAISYAGMNVSATRSIDWEMATLEVNGRELDIVIEHILDYGLRGDRLSETDWDDWKQQVVDEFGERFGLLITEREPSAGLSVRLRQVSEHVYLEHLPSRSFAAPGVLVLVSLEDRPSDDRGSARIEAARDIFLVQLRRDARDI